MTRSWRTALVTLTLPAMTGATGIAGVASITSAGDGAERTATPVAVRTATDTVLVAARELRRGAVLGAGDIDTLIVEASTSGSGPDMSVRAAEPGWIVRRLLRQGEPLRPPAVAPPALVAAGAQVTLVWQVGELHVTRQGTTVGPGHLGDQVVVRVDATRRFTGRVTGPGTVAVDSSP